MLLKITSPVSVLILMWLLEILKLGMCFALYFCWVTLAQALGYIPPG